jgi:pimeloyl-ACP methyl ester carboxylesterase
MHDRFVQTRHGRLHWLDSQSADDTQHPQTADLPPLILLHSAGGSAYEWQLVWTALSAQRRVLALDLPGHGDSDPLSRHYGIADYAAAVAEWIASIGLLHDEHDGHDGQKPVLAGSSVISEAQAVDAARNTVMP